MNLLETFVKNQAKEKNAYPEVKPGAVVRVHQKFVEVLAQTKSKKQAKAKEAEKVRERIQIFEGLVISRHGKSPISTVTVRKISDGIGTEYIFPLDLPSIKKIEVVKQNKVRRAKLYYLRGRTGKAIKLRDAIGIAVAKKREKARAEKSGAKTEVKEKVKAAEISK